MLASDKMHLWNVRRKNRPGWINYQMEGIEGHGQ